MNYALIPARGGSKGIEGKNLKTIGGLPLIARSIIAATASKYIEKVYVSSDSTEILRVAQRYGAIPIIRPCELADDESSTDVVISHFINQLASDFGVRPDIITLIQATYAFLTPHHIDRVIERLNEPYDCAFGASKTHMFLWKKDTDRANRNAYRLANHDHIHTIRPRRQDLSEQYVELGSVYAMKSEAFLRTKSRFCSNPLPVDVKNSIVYEIDNIKDLQVCRVLSRYGMHDGYKGLFSSKNLRLILCDFDGVLTDNSIMTDSNGNEIVKTIKSDSLAIKFIREKHNIAFEIVTSEMNNTHLKRAEKIGVRINRARGSKSEVVSRIIGDYNIRLSGNKYEPSVIFVGNDLNDIPAIPLVDLFVCPSDSNVEVISKSDIITMNRGGEGVISELYAMFFNSESVESV